MADISLKGIDPDTMKIILDVQNEQKKFLGVNQYSLSRAVIKIIKEWNNKCKQAK